MDKPENLINPTKKVAISEDDKNLNALSQYLNTVQASHKRSIPPLENWHPAHCGRMDLKVLANGEWWHEGQLIKRQRLIDLFSTVLWKEDQRFYLKTPVEKIEIEVEDEPLFINQVDQVEIAGKSYLQLTSTTQDVLLVDEEHPIFMREFETELRPYVHVRFGINALIQRAAFLHLVHLGELLEDAEGQTYLSLKSGDLHLQLSS